METQLLESTNPQNVKKAKIKPVPPEVRSAISVGNREEGAGPGAIEAGQSHDGTWTCFLQE